MLLRALNWGRRGEPFRFADHDKVCVVVASAGLSLYVSVVERAYVV
jgi:hypothetical protein